MGYFYINAECLPLTTGVDVTDSAFEGQRWR